MKITLDMENLADAVQNAVNDSINEVINEQIAKMIAKQTQESAKEIIETIVNEKLKSYVEDYIKTATISIGGGWCAEPEVYTVEKYIQHQIAEIMESKSLASKDSRGYVKNVTFEDFVKAEFDVNTKVQNALKQFMDGVKKNINQNISNMFDQATQAALSSSITSLLMSSNTFMDMKDSIQRITDGK